MPVSETSIKHHRKLGDIGELSRQEKEVYNAIKSCNESCIADVAKWMNWEKSTVAARMNALNQKGYLTSVGKRKSETTNVTSQFFKVKNFRETLF